MIVMTIIMVILCHLPLGASCVVETVVGNDLVALGVHRTEGRAARCFGWAAATAGAPCVRDAVPPHPRALPIIQVEGGSRPSARVPHDCNICAVAMRRRPPDHEYGRLGASPALGNASGVTQL